MKPKPFSALNHLTVPCGIPVLHTRRGPSRLCADRGLHGNTDEAETSTHACEAHRLLPRTLHNDRGGTTATGGKLTTGGSPRGAPGNAAPTVCDGWPHRVPALGRSHVDRPVEAGCTPIRTVLRPARLAAYIAVSAPWMRSTSSLPSAGN